MRTRGLITLAVAATALLVSCSVDPLVTAERSDQIASPRPTPTTPTTTPPVTTDQPQDDPPATEPTQDETAPTDPASTVPAPSVAPDQIDPAAIDFGPNKTPATTTTSCAR